MSKSIIPLALLSATIAVPAVAQWTPATEARLTREYRQCERDADNAPTLSTGYIADATECTENELVRQDDRLNQAYKMVMMRLGPQRRIALRNAQRGWIAQRDRVCDRGLEGGGTATYMDSRQCHLSRTINRIMWLERYR